MAWRVRGFLSWFWDIWGFLFLFGFAVVLFYKGVVRLIHHVLGVLVEFVWVYVLFPIYGSWAVTSFLKLLWLVLYFRRIWKIYCTRILILYVIGLVFRRERRWWIVSSLLVVEVWLRVNFHTLDYVEIIVNPPKAYECVISSTTWDTQEWPERDSHFYVGSSGPWLRQTKPTSKQTKMIKGIKYIVPNPRPASISSWIKINGKTMQN